MYNNLSEHLNLYYLDGSRYYDKHRKTDVNNLEIQDTFLYFFYLPMVPTNGMWSGVKEAPINYGIFDTITKKEVTCPISIGYVYIASAIWKSEMIKDGIVTHGNFCYFKLRIFSKDRKRFEDIILQTHIRELSNYIEILNHYISSYKDLDSISFVKLKEFINSHDYDRLRGTAVYLVDNILYGDFVKYLYSAKCTTHTSCSYSTRKGEYRHADYTTLVFKTNILAFHIILANILKGKSSKEDNCWSLEFKTDESVDYSGGISVGPEEEGAWDNSDDTYVKEDIIKDIINKTYNSFPDKITTICQMIDNDIISKWADIK